MREPKHLSLKFPILGLNRNWAKREQPENTTIDCENVRGYDYDDRSRGGQRPGMSAYSSALAASTKIQVLGSLVTVPINAASSTNLGVRSLNIYGVCGGKLYAIPERGAGGAASTPTSPTRNGDYLFSPNSPYIGRANNLGFAYLCDGRAAIKYDPDSSVIRNWVNDTVDNGSGTFPQANDSGHTAVSTTRRERTSGVATFTTATHSLAVGDTVTVTAMTDATFNGTWIVTTVPSTTTFTCYQEDSSYAAEGDVGDGADVGGSVQRIRLPRLCVNWRGRIVCAGLPGADAHNWFMSATGDPTDWDYSPATILETQAVAGNSSNAGKIGEVVQTLIPFNDDIMLFGSESSIWQLTGDPMVGGRFDLITDVTGMTFGTPWCKDDNGAVYFFGSRGHVYRVSTSNSGGQIDNLTASRMPSEFENINLDTFRVELVWNDDAQGVHVIIIPLSGTADNVSYFYSARLDAWFKDKFGQTRSPTCTHTIDGDAPDDRYGLLGQEDGIIRYFNEDSKSDNGVAISSYVYLGPFRVEEGQVPFLLSELQATLAKDSDDVSFRVYIGNSCEDASNISGSLILQTFGRIKLQSGGFLALQGSTSESHTDIFSGDFSATRSIVHYPRKRGYAAYVKLFNNNDAESWSIETLRAKLLVILTSLRRQRT